MERPLQQNADVEADETASLIASDKVEGTSVYNHSGEKLGSVHNVMINKISGQVSYVVVSFGGFLGIGSEYNAVPWKKLTFNSTMGGYEIDVPPERLQGAPRYAAGEEPWVDPLYGRSVDDYYGLTP
ncbi:PRC-barrel domain-containing protein [Rhodopila sp.]|uniref:PRC-barrel domain-containing protein n=1 Tax=Rhodopila sp. TaxID=2480087 RepID=UPI002C719D03|nr:PRC-barrel domain-containing protein [Rhodopila sp.]HVZ06851.1 PRC-barrel domain-containing protein [Rhodopila sp.]